MMFKKRCRSSVYCERPNQWLEYVLGLVESEESRSRLFSTRRGGGLPFFVQAIVSTELTESGGRKSLARSMRVLLKLAEANFSVDEQNFSKVFLI